MTRPGILAKTGNQCNFLLDSRLRGNDRRLRSPTHGAVDPDISNIFPGRDTRDCMGITEEGTELKGQKRVVGSASRSL
jgi:hypothetical protein